jgi:hypothetical protein
MRRSTRFAIALCVAFVPLSAAAQTADEILARFGAEPTILEVQEAAAAYAHIDQGQLAGWMRRANIANILPRVRGDWRRIQDDRLQSDIRRDFDADPFLGEILDDVERDQRIQDNTRTEYRVQLDWDLRDLIFNPDVIRVSNERADIVELREDILTTVTSLYFERRRAQVQMVLDPPADAVQRLRRELELQELTARLDAYTGGWFSAQLSRAGLTTY